LRQNASVCHEVRKRNHHWLVKDLALKCLNCDDKRELHLIDET
jgi:hypothetical protein